MSSMNKFNIDGLLRSAVKAASEKNQALSKDEGVEEGGFGILRHWERKQQEKQKKDQGK